jgi:hypothetical protein
MTRLRHIKMGSSFSPLGGNALVPSNARILPAQTWVDNIDQFVSSAYDYGVSITGPLTYIDPTLLNTWLFYSCSYISGSTSIDLSGKSLTTSNIDEILSVLANTVEANGFYGGILDLSGGTNAPPTPESTPVDGEWSLDVAAMVADTPVNLFDDGEGYANLLFSVFLSSSIDFADSTPGSVGYGQNVMVGIQDSPPLESVAEYIANALEVGFSGTVLSGTFTLDYSPNVAIGPISGSGPGLTIVNPGIPYAENGSIWTFYNHNWTLKFNDPLGNPVTYVL